MISMVLALGIIVALYFTVHAVLIHRYYKTKYTPNLYFGVTSCFLALATLFGMLVLVVTSANNLPLTILLYRFSATSGTLAFVFLNVFAIAMTKPGEKMSKMRGIWIPFACFLIITFIFWAFDIFLEGVVGGVNHFTITSMYKVPYGLPLIETVLALMAVMAVYPTYLFFRVVKDTKDKIIKMKSLWMGIGIIIGTVAYAMEMTGAISYHYMPAFKPMAMIGLIGSFMVSLGYLMPRKMEQMLFGRALASADSIVSFIAIEPFVERFFVSPVAPTVTTQKNVFSKTLGLTHQQLVGRKILFEFDPASSYEKAIQDFAAEALANIEPTVVFTRRGSAIHSALREQEAVKFFCLMQQVSVPREFSENEMLLPARDTSLMLDVFDKTLKAHPEGNINVVFDSLSDLVLSIGFEKTYRFMKYAIEMLASPKTTVLFLLNQTAHDTNVMSGLRHLFSNQISFDEERIQIVKLSKAEFDKVKTRNVG